MSTLQRGIALAQSKVDSVTVVACRLLSHVLLAVLSL